MALHRVACALVLGVTHDTLGAWHERLGPRVPRRLVFTWQDPSILVHVHSGMPATLTFDQAVSLPVVWTTAHYCFAQAQLRSVQDLLVHAASGGVGLVSMEWARMARATTHATAGGMAKHVLLRATIARQ